MYEWQVLPPTVVDTHVELMNLVDVTENDDPDHVYK